MAEFICGGEKYEVGGVKSRAIGLPVKPAGLPPTVDVKGYTLQQKTAFHVTLVAMGEIARKHGVTDPDFENKIVSDFCAFTAEHPIELIRYRDEYYFATEGEKRTIVVMCDVSNLDKFFDMLNQKYGLSVEYPPTHVTIYTLQPNVGIFLTDSEEMQTRAKHISSPVKL